MRNKYHFLLVVLLTILGIAFVGWFFINIAIYVVVSLILTTVLLPLTERLTHVNIMGRSTPRSVSAMISLLCLGMAIYFAASAFLPMLKEQITGLIDNEVRLNTFFLKVINALESFLAKYNIINEKGYLIAELSKIGHKLWDEVKIEEVFGVVFSLTGSVLVGTLAVVFMTFMFLFEKGRMRRALLNRVSNKYFEFVVTAVHKVRLLLVNYLVGLLIQMFFIFCLSTLGLSLVGVKYAMTIGFLTAVFNLIPYFGPMFGAIFGVIVGITTGDQEFGSLFAYIVYITKILGVFAIVQMIDNITLQPLIYSKSVKAHPLEIFVVIFAGANLGGVIGMIFAIPFYTVLKVTTGELSFGYRNYQIFKR